MVNCQNDRLLNWSIQNPEGLRLHNAINLHETAAHFVPRIAEVPAIAMELSVVDEQPEITIFTVTLVSVASTLPRPTETVPLGSM